MARSGRKIVIYQYLSFPIRLYHTHVPYFSPFFSAKCVPYLENCHSGFGYKCVTKRDTLELGTLRYCISENSLKLFMKCVDNL